MKEKDLIKLKKKVDSAQSESEQLKGKKEVLLNQLKDEFGCNSIEEAKAKAKELEKSNSKLSDKIDKKISKLKEKFNVED